MFAVVEIKWEGISGRPINDGADADVVGVLAS
jgi:hypothetical protein